MDELSIRRHERKTGRKLSPGLTNPLRPIYHPDQHILPALRCLDEACRVSYKNPQLASFHARTAIKHAQRCGLEKVIRSAMALLLALRF